MQTELRLYKNIAPLAGLGIWEHDLVKDVIYWNDVVRVILELGEVAYPSVDEALSYYKDPVKARHLIDRAVLSGSPESADLELIGAKGTHKCVNIRIQAEYSKGKCVRIYGTIQDITAHKKLLKALEEREQRFANAFDHAPIGMALVSLTGGWIKVNTSLCELFGYAEEDFLQHTFQDFTFPADLDADLKQLQQLIAGKISTYSMEKRYYHADGRLIWALLNVSLVRNDLGEPLYFVSQIKDVTERKRNMEIIRDQNGRLLNFAHIVSHNLRSHSGNIRMLTSMIQQEEDEAEKDQMLRLLDDNAANLLETLEHLNEIVRIHAGEEKERPELPLTRELDRVLTILSPSIMASQANIIKDVPDDVKVAFDPAYLESVLVNLISNALKYRHPDRRPELIIRTIFCDGVPLLSVADNGLGIDLKLHGHKLFGMYKTFHRHPDARGMGLFLVKNQVEAMGGQIWAESQPGVGTTFFVQFNPVYV
ncbi:sensor histidine kinase [Mucilaginibacter myungsuensis]|uniref:histidine kinase n=1 Tax=Mucilaginibacter myungsuensis TaxID=649104 RepID=A0A929L2K4_9SPHI|nr:HAMP domain-containing sensor histidine kinase [Mucilaginibacter myungsuensis]MBE9662925.1 PAS domain S-box protein [Mucilaginibacter myungsuensis]MDN3598547.1 PAS domain S-box protein [Mucilaginibacter myungsuensis]